MLNTIRTTLAQRYINKLEEMLQVCKQDYAGACLGKKELMETPNHNKIVDACTGARSLLRKLDDYSQIPYVDFLDTQIRRIYGQAYRLRHNMI